MKDFKIRCSAIGKIMSALKTITKAEQTKYNKLLIKCGQGSLSDADEAELNTIIDKVNRLSSELPQSAKTYCREWFIEQLYGRRKEIKSKYLTKGIEGEDDAIDLVIDYEGLGYNEKNEEYRENEFLTGTPDLIYDDLIIDVKCSWSCFSFPFFDTEVDNQDYYYQLQGYMSLFDKPNAMLSYALVDAPRKLIEDEIYYQGKAAGGITQEIADRVEHDMTYSGIAPKHRVKSFKFERDDSVIKEIQERVKMCRLYISQLQEEYL